MKLLLLLALVAIVAAAPKVEKHDVQPLDFSVNGGERNLLVNILIRQLINFIRGIINDGFGILGVPPLDPLRLEEFNLVVPAGLINLNLELRDVLVTGIGGFIVHKSELRLSDLSFEIDISVPCIDVSTELYDLDGDLLTAIPIYGNGRAEFKIEEFRFRAKLFLKQSDNERAVVLERIDDVDFEIPAFTSNLNGAIGGGDIDAIVNAIVEEVLVDYVIRFRGAISKIAAGTLVLVANPILEQLDTWRFIAPLLPSTGTFKQTQ